MMTLHDTLPCAHCNTPLGGIPLDGTCRGCGAPAAATLDLTVIDSETGEINDDASCAGCDYNLRSLGLGGVCPECGRRVIESLRPDALWLAEPRWRKSILKGVDLLLLTGIAIPAVSGTILLVRETSLYVASALTMILGGFTLLILSLITIGAIACVSARDTTRWDQPKRFWPHTFAGILPLVNVLWAVVLFAFSAAVFYVGSLAVLALGIAFILLLISVLVNLAAITTCLRRVATRARAHSLRKATLRWYLGFIGVLVLYIVTSILGVYSTFGSNAAWEFLLGLVALAACTLYVLAIVGLGGYRKLLHEAHVRFTAVAAPAEAKPIQQANAA